ncbi:hypothetical protein G6011_05165 [Alternaria panax]|uniref:Uncharacterized protein n=1 Tax=Alternaria panax TaxID=48097 RepID=A0AAD4FGS5_9PLEO|nr:hypothetical protein G6011_05165 [Alternaria panax]
MAIKEANVRRQSELWTRMTSVVVRRPTTARVAGQSEENISGEESLTRKCERPTIEFEGPPPDLNERTENGLDNTSLMFNDNSFDESVSPDQQTTALNIFGRKMVTMKRLGLGLRTNRDWFIGLARCPAYTGDLIGIARVRPRAETRVGPDVVVGNWINGSASTVASIPTKNTASTPSAVPKTSAKIISAAIVSGTTKQQPNKSQAKPTFSTGTTTSTQKARNPTVPMAVSRNTYCEGQAAHKSATNRSKTVSKSLQTSDLKTLRHPTQKPIRSYRSKLTVKPISRPMSKTSTAVTSAIRKPKLKVVKKHVCFVEGLNEPRFYSTEDTVKQSAITIDELPPSFRWEPLTGLLHSHLSCQDNGSAELFEGTSSGSYEARCRGEDSAQGKRATLGQLEYGNADIKIAVQATNTITAHDVGILQDLSAIGKAGKLLGGRRSTITPVLIFGSFKEPFENAAIPKKIVNPYKKPLRWPATRSEGRLEEFAAQNLKCLQVADLDG